MFILYFDCVMEIKIQPELQREKIIAMTYVILFLNEYFHTIIHLLRFLFLFYFVMWAIQLIKKKKNNKDNDSRYIIKAITFLDLVKKLLYIANLFIF